MTCTRSTILCVVCVKKKVEDVFIKHALGRPKKKTKSRYSLGGSS